MFSTGYHAEYHEFNAGAHRNTPKNLRAPVLVSHLGFWTAQVAGRAQPDGTVAEDIKPAVDAFIIEFCRRARAVDKDLLLLPNVSGKILLFGTIVDPVSLQKDCGAASSLTRRQRDIFESGMRSVTIKFRWKDLDATIRLEVHTEHFTLTTFVELDKHRTRTPFSTSAYLNFHIDSTLAYLQAAVDCSPSGNTSNYFFESFWDEWDAQFHSFHHNIDKPNQSGGAFECVFADFRGVIFSEDAALFPDRRFFRSGRKPTWGEAAKRKLLPFLTAHDSNRLRKYECAINYLLDGRALLLSTLAPQLPEVPIEKRIPVRYVLFAHNRDDRGKIVVNKWQLGRLVNLLHQLGTVRLAGLKDLKELHIVGQKLSQIDHKLQGARESIAVKDETAMEKIQITHKDFNSIVKQFLDAAGCSILYRIERSRYYIKQFNVGKVGLRILRLEGDQPYDQFVERRLGAQYDFVDRLGVRYERTASSIAMLDNNYLLIKAAKIDSEANKINEDIKVIQDWGEFFLLLFLVPYYVSHQAEMLVNEYYVPMVALVIWVLFGVYALWKKWRWHGMMGALVCLILLCFSAAVFRSTVYKCDDFFRFCPLFGG